MTIDHVGIAVESLERSIPFYRLTLGLEPVHREDVPSQSVRVAFLKAPGDCGRASVELLEPTGPEGAVSNFLKTRGPGLHHVAFAVERLSAEMERLSEEGFPALEKDPRDGARGHKVCFLHPREFGGVLVELVEAHGRP